MIVLEMKAKEYAPCHMVSFLNMLVLRGPEFPSTEDLCQVFPVPAIKLASPFDRSVLPIAIANDLYNPFALLTGHSYFFQHAWSSVGMWTDHHEYDLGACNGPSCLLFPTPLRRGFFERMVNNLEGRIPTTSLLNDKVFELAVIIEIETYKNWCLQEFSPTCTKRLRST